MYYNQIINTQTKGGFLEQVGGYLILEERKNDQT